ncbi:MULTISPECIES: hypothetical protein [Allobaculum]|uniref:hypothetical protein n=1 Tax=Allobaculum TaxID=174708 RepID=UPI001E384B49|nr:MULTISPECIES: hypothetical protein [Allobaculum]UNT93149.1 hypothetical protein KWG61_14215 [Allobaculum sp. Allo2]
MEKLIEFRRYPLDMILDKLLIDKTTGKRIIWQRMATVNMERITAIVLKLLLVHWPELIRSSFSQEHLKHLKRSSNGPNRRQKCSLHPGSSTKW